METGVVTAAPGGTASVTIADMVGLAAERFAETPALLRKAGDGWQPVTYRELGDIVSELARGFIGLGVACGDHVALLCRTRPEWDVRRPRHHERGRRRGADLPDELGGGVPVGGRELQGPGSSSARRRSSWRRSAPSAALSRTSRPWSSSIPPPARRRQPPLRPGRAGEALRRARPRALAGDGRAHPDAQGQALRGRRAVRRRVRPPVRGGPGRLTRRTTGAAARRWSAPESAATRGRAPAATRSGRRPCAPAWRRSRSRAARTPRGAPRSPRRA
jgi:hypothetical protein